jgi:hypothetical protein
LFNVKNCYDNLKDFFSSEKNSQLLTKMFPAGKRLSMLSQFQALFERAMSDNIPSDDEIASVKIQIFTKLDPYFRAASGGRRYLWMNY